MDQRQTNIAALITMAAKRRGITNSKEIGIMVGNFFHESGGFVDLEEKLDYTAPRLIKVWPSRFNLSNASSYAHNPVKLANYVYAGRNGNGDEASGDGWKYRGRGFTHLTGRANYAAVGKIIGVDIVNNPDMVSKNLNVAIESAVGYWLVTASPEHRQQAQQGNIQSGAKVINSAEKGVVLARRNETVKKVMSNPVLNTPGMAENLFNSLAAQGARDRQVKEMAERSKKAAEKAKNNNMIGIISNTFRVSSKPVFPTIFGTKKR